MTKTNKTEQVEESQREELYNQFELIVSGLNTVKIQISNLQQNLKHLEKGVKKQMKGLKKEVNKNKNKGNRKPSGFARPSKVTKELCSFMNKDEGTEIARTEVTRALVSYIKEHKLENTDNSKIITPDLKLKELLGIEDGQELTYFTIQKFMNKHFVKNVIEA
jgi:chromatin remodeling complex protein RSC6